VLLNCSDHLKHTGPDVESGLIVLGGAMLEEPIKDGVPPKMKGSVLMCVADTEEEVWERVKRDVYWEKGVWDREKVSSFLGFWVFLKGGEEMRGIGREEWRGLERSGVVVGYALGVWRAGRDGDERWRRSLELLLLLQEMDILETWYQWTFSRNAVLGRLAGVSLADNDLFCVWLTDGFTCAGPDLPLQERYQAGTLEVSLLFQPRANRRALLASSQYPSSFTGANERVRLRTIWLNVLEIGEQRQCFNVTRLKS
jgi:hypothetical protein